MKTPCNLVVNLFEDGLQSIEQMRLGDVVKVSILKNQKKTGSIAKIDINYLWLLGEGSVKPLALETIISVERTLCRETLWEKMYPRRNLKVADDLMVKMPDDSFETGKFISLFSGFVAYVCDDRLSDNGIIRVSPREEVVFSS